METGLLCLKAELQRKKSEAKTCTNKLVVHPPKKSTSSVTKDKLNKNCKRSVNIIDDTVADELNKSKSILEQKAALYEKLKGGQMQIDENMRETLLIDFKAKTDKVPGVNVSQSPGSGEIKTFLPPDQILNQYHENWAKMEQVSKSKDSVHYSDVFFDEARSHGAGFVRFSSDESTRLEQQRDLREMSAKSTAAAAQKEKIRVSKQLALSERLVKVRQRKRLKLGLPIKDESDSLPEPVLPFEGGDSKVREDEVSREINDQQGMNSKPKSSAVREWDIGKPGVSAPKFNWVKERRSDPMSQSQWNALKGAERNPEFAPPS